MKDITSIWFFLYPLRLFIYRGSRVIDFIQVINLLISLWLSCNEMITMEMDCIDKAYQLFIKTPVSVIDVYICFVFFSPFLSFYALFFMNVCLLLSNKLLQAFFMNKRNLYSFHIFHLFFCVKVLKIQSKLMTYFHRLSLHTSERGQHQIIRVESRHSIHHSWPYGQWTGSKCSQ